MITQYTTSQRHNDKDEQNVELSSSFLGRPEPRKWWHQGGTSRGKCPSCKDLCHSCKDLCPGCKDLCPSCKDLCPGCKDLCPGCAPAVGWPLGGESRNSGSQLSAKKLFDNRHKLIFHF